MNSFKVEINGTDYSKYAVFPIQLRETVDGSLSGGYCFLKNMIRSKPFKPMSKIVITEIDSEGVEKVFYGTISSDNFGAILGINRYNHSVLFSEEIKETQKFLLTKTFTNSLKTSYNDVIIGNTPSSIYADWEKVAYTTEYNTVKLLYKTVYPVSQSIECFPYSGHFPSSLPIPYPTVRVDVYKNLVLISSSTSGYTIPASDTKALYSVRYISVSGSTEVTLVVFDFYTVPDSSLIIKKKTITDVVNGILRTTSLRRLYRFVFRSDQATLYSEVEAPEFSFTKQTIYEALVEVGKTIHAIPKMANGEVYFLPLSGIQSTEPVQKYYSQIFSQSDEQYATFLDCDVDNLINNRDEGAVIREPAFDLWKNVRSESGVVQVTEDNAVIETTDRIYKVLKVEVGRIPTGGTTYTSEIGDITNYVFEETDYNILSEYETEVGKAKCYAIYYKRGEKNIKGLSFLKPAETETDYQYYAIKNIIHLKNNSVAQGDYLMNQIMFRVTYIPIMNARLLQSKQYLSDFGEGYSSAFNQSSNQVDTRSFGQNMRGTIDKMGNVGETRVYNFLKFDDIPQLCAVYPDGNFVTTIQTALYPNTIKTQVSLAKDFNNLSAYVGINNNLRQWEVSERQAYDYRKVYSEYCVIGDDIYGNRSTSLGPLGLQQFRATFINTDSFFELGAVRTYENTNASIKYSEGLDLSISTYSGMHILPVVSLALGNSIALLVNYQDNFSAGRYENVKNETSLLFPKTVYDVVVKLIDGFKLSAFDNYYQNYSNYCDSLGNLTSVRLEFTDGIYNSNAETNLYKRDFQSALALPNYSYEYYFPKYLTTPTLYVDKGNRDILSIAYQLHFILEDRAYIIGTSFSEYVRFVTNKTQSSSLYILPDNISQYTDVLDLTGATLVKQLTETDFTIDATNRRIKLANQTANANGKAWAIVENDGNHLFIGKNCVINNSEEIIMPYFNFVYEIEEIVD